MPGLKVRTGTRVLLACVFATIVRAQQPPPVANNQPAPEPVATFKASSRMVTVEVVVKDHKGQPVTGLSADDFQVFEQETGWRKEKRPQKIASLRAINISEIPTQRQSSVQPAPGVYTNLVTLQNNPVPPTIMLMDALNTPWADRAQVRVQMVRMLRTLPDDVPVAVFLLGRQLRLLQNFTTDPKLLKSALERSTNVEAGDLQETDPRDDPEALSAILEDVPGAPLDVMQRFEQEAFAGSIDVRERVTLDALRSLARHVSGYPGRKNLLWISSSFPILLNPDFENASSGGSSLYGSGMRNYAQDIQEIANLLGDANIAVYPIDPGGLQGSALAMASTRPRGNMARGSTASGIIMRQDIARNSRVDTMEAMADATGGRVCVNDNDLADCVKKAVNDSGYFYEIAYYPDSKDWHGEFRKILVEARQSGLHLSYRRGYYATPEPLVEQDPKKRDEQLQRAACRDLLTSTSILLGARQLPQEQTGARKYFIVADLSTIGVAQSASGATRLELQFAACTFEQTGKPLQFWHDSVSQELSAKQYAGVQAGHGYPHIMAFSPVANAVAVRFVVRDLTTGKVGSVNLPLSGNVAGTGATPAFGAQHSP